MKKNYKAALFMRLSGHASGPGIMDFNQQTYTGKPSRRKNTKKLTLHKIGGMENNVYRYIRNYVDLGDSNTVILRTRSIDTISHLAKDLGALVNLKKVNDIRRVNKFFEEVNGHLADGAMYVGAVEVSEQRKARILRKFPNAIATFFYMFDFIFRRVLPKLNLTKGFYFFVTDGRNRVMSKSEVLGRLVACGFEIENLKSIGETLYFVARKVKVPSYDLKPSYGPLFKMKRIGKNGKIIQVYKFRTMHPYSEYLQDYVIRTNGYQDIGKPADDFRITTWGKFLRKYWLDELPQLINVARGEMKLVGIRPVSTRFLNEFPEDIRELRLKQKPGCVPAYVSLLKQSVDGFIEAESIYLREKIKHPYTTDIKYLVKAVFNILSNKIRSA
jgi:lipopolysaccharide/colanic/teichoic acid biosynthesis glycosyltransferase